MTDIEDLMAYIAASPSPYHAVATTAARLDAAGFDEVDLSAAWTGGGARYVRRGGAIVAWVDAHQPAGSRFRIVGAHTDSPNLRVKPRPDHGRVGWRQVAVEVYGGPLWNSWLDRDLGLSGRVVVATADGLSERLVLVDRPLARIPQLAIHLDRNVNGEGLKLNPQHHLDPVWGLGSCHDGDFRRFVAGEAGVDESDIRGWDLMFHDLAPPARLGLDGELVASARLDNLLSCWAGVEALVAASSTGAPPPAVPVVCLFDHEEVGSTSATGADGALLAQVLERSVLARQGGREDLLRATAGSVCASVDMAHATHPNHPDRHDPDHLVEVGAGPVLKLNASQRYATDATTNAVMVEAFERAGVPHQVFVSRNDQPCGSTIGPLTAARLGIGTVDVGVPQLSMHSARELCGSEDPLALLAGLREFLAG